MEELRYRTAVVDGLEGEALADLLASAGSDVFGLGLSQQRFAPGGFRVVGCRALDHSLLNRILGVGSSGCTTDEAQRVLDAWSVQHRDARLWLDLPEWLLERWQPWLDRRRAIATGVGREILTHDGSLPPLVRTDVEISRATSSDAAAVGLLLARAFGLPASAAMLFRGVVVAPRWHVFVGRVEGRLDAAASLFVSGDRGFLGPCGTALAARRGGAHFALTALAIRAALNLGCRTIATAVPDAGTGDGAAVLRNLERLGLRRVTSTRGFALVASDGCRALSQPRHSRKWRRESAHVAGPSPADRSHSRGR